MIRREAKLGPQLPRDITPLVVMQPIRSMTAIISAAICEPDQEIFSVYADPSREEYEFIVPPNPLQTPCKVVLTHDTGSLV